uniref:Uncharacterized protein n=1 Tax=Anguilla anguilla TaxID=7936 RepID=A0A0E9RGR5_ANGAN
MHTVPTHHESPYNINSKCHSFSVSCAYEDILCFMFF